MLTFVPPGNLWPQISAPGGGTYLSSGNPTPGCSLIASFIVACLAYTVLDSNHTLAWIRGLTLQVWQFQAFLICDKLRKMALSVRLVYFALNLVVYVRSLNYVIDHST